MTDERTQPIRRAVSSVAMDNGEWTWKKFFSIVGQWMCVWLIYYNAPALINHWEVLVVLLGFLILPDMMKKVIMLIFSRGIPTQGYERTERSREVVTTNKMDDRPLPKGNQSEPK